MKTLHDKDSYATAIAAAWNKSLDSILDAASLCAQADEALSSAEKADLLAQLPFAAPTFSKLVKIGNDSRLRREDVRRHLPPSYSIIYEAALLSDGQLRQAIADGVLHPEAKRTEVQACAATSERVLRARLPLFDDEPDKTVPAKKKEMGVCFAELRIPSDFSAEDRARLENELLRVAESFGIEFVRRLTPEERFEGGYLKRMNAFSRRWVRYGLQLTRQRVQEVKKARTRGGKKWGFAPDETYLDAFAGWTEIEQVLDLIGIADELEDIRRRAEQLAKAPEFDPPVGYGEANLTVEPTVAPHRSVMLIPADTFSDWK